jgi:hypothetical protein
VLEDMDEALITTELERVFGDGDNANVEGKDVLSEGAAAHTHYFGSSSITVGKIKEMEEKGYFMRDEARALGAETVLEPCDDEAVVYDDFFVAGLCMPPHPALGDILLHFQAQLHQLTANIITQLCHTPFRERGNEASIRVPRMFKSHAW